MSVHALSWVFKQTLENAGAKFVLVALANFADEDGRSFPSQKRLARETGFGERTVRRHIEWLEDNGWITRVERRREDGTRTSDEFQIVTNRPKCPADATGQNVQTNRPNSTESPANLAGHEPVSEPSEEPKGRKRISYPSDFEDFWKLYPTDPNMSKLKAYEKWKKLSADDRKSCSAGVPGFRKYCFDNKSYRPVHACRFISERRFEGFAPSGGAQDGQKTIAVRKGTPEWNAWVAYRREQGKTFNPDVLSVPSSYPPVNVKEPAQ